jgi:acetoin utilization protein AcuB
LREAGPAAATSDGPAVAMGKNMRTAAAMTREVLVVQPELSLAVADELMREKHIRHLPVVQGGRLAGILSDRDVLRYRESAAQMSCGEAMTPAPVTCHPDTSVGRVAQLMLHHKIDSVPVVNEVGTLVGLVTSSDLLALLIDRAEVERLPFEFRLHVARTESVMATA